MSLTPGLLYLAASIACSVTVAAMLKLARAIDVRQAIAVNYAVAATVCWALLRPASDTLFAAGTPWLTLAALGILLPSVFLAWRRPCAMPAWRAATRRSPVHSADRRVPVRRDAGRPRSRWRSARCIACCAAARRRTASPPRRPRPWLWPLIVWAGYGVIDVLFKQVAHRFGTLLLAFMLTGMLMLGYLRRARWSGAMRWRVAGLANFGNI